MIAALTPEDERTSGEKGHTFFIYFLTTIAFSQFFLDHSRLIAAFFLGISFLLIVALMVVGSRASLLFFLFFVILMNIVIPFTGDRTFSQILPALFLPIIIVKSRKVGYVWMGLIGFCMLLYFVILAMSVFHGMQLPTAISGADAGNTGFLARWNLLNTVLVFVATFMSFEVETFPNLLRKFYRLFLIILILSLIIFYFNIGANIPIFNTFGWSVLLEGSGSKRMGIAGVAAVYVLIYFLCFKTSKRMKLITIFLIVLGIVASGGRSAMLAFFIILYLSLVIRYKVLIRSVVVSGVIVFLFLAFSLSPLILYIPQRLQRLFIIFPKEFYADSVSSTLEESAAANSSSFRFNMWKLAVPDIRENIFLGKGLGIPEQSYSFSGNGLSSFQTKSTEILYHDFMAGGQLHNTFVSIAYVMGIPAALLFLYSFCAMIFRTYRYYNTSPDEYKPFLKFLLLLLFNSLSSSMLGDLHFDLVFFMFLAMTAKTLNQLRSKETIEPALNLN